MNRGRIITYIISFAALSCLIVVFIIDQGAKTEPGGFIALLYLSISNVLFGTFMIINASKNWKKSNFIAVLLCCGIIVFLFEYYCFNKQGYTHHYTIYSTIWLGILFYYSLWFFIGVIKFFGIIMLKHDTQIDKEKLGMFDFPKLVSEQVEFEGKTYSLIEWIEIFKNQEIFSWSLPEIDYGEPRCTDWHRMRNSVERNKMESDYINNRVTYTTIIFKYIQEGKVHLDKQQYGTMCEAIVWLSMATKYTMLRREFFALASAMRPEVDKILRSLY
jgi:hypothetical protein